MFIWDAHKLRSGANIPALNKFIVFIMKFLVTDYWVLNRNVLYLLLNIRPKKK